MLFRKFETSQEKILERIEEEEENREKLENFIKRTAENLQREGVPVTEDCRIDISAFSKVYSENVIERDKKLIKEYESQWYPGLSEEEIKKERLKIDGEKLERSKNVIFAKNLGKDFIVVRTSLYDDIKNKVDNLILEKETGNLVCALDEVADISEQRLEEKKNKVFRGKKHQTNRSYFKIWFKH